MESTLKVEDLKKLSLKQLEKFATGVEGEDLVLVNEVIASKKASASTEEVKTSATEEDPAKAEAKLAAEIEKARLKEEKIAAAEKLRQEKIAAALAKEEAKEKAAQERIEKQRLADEVRAAAKAEREIAIKEMLERKKQMAEEKAAKKLALEEMKVKMAEEKKAAREARIEELKAKMQEINLDRNASKTDQVRECMLKGMKNSEIVAATGFSTKFICDTTWRLERQTSYWLEKKKREDALVAKELAQADAGYQGEATE